MTLQEAETAPGLETLDATELNPIESWVSEAPLKLVAWALDSMGRKGNSTAIKNKLEGHIGPDLTWTKWWAPVRRAIEESGKSGKLSLENRNFYLMSDVATVPDTRWDSLTGPVKKAKTKTASVADWKKWLLSDVPEPPPGVRPTKPVCNALAKLTAKDIARALDRTMWGAGEFLASGNPTAQAAAGWMEAVSWGFIRFRELSEPDDVLSLSAQVGELLARLVKVARFPEESAGLLLAAGALPGEPDPWRREFTAGLWWAFQESGGGARDLLDSMPDYIGRSALAWELVIAALRATNPLRHHARLDRVLDCLRPSDRVHIFNDLIVRSANGEAPKQAVLDYVSASRHSGRPSDSTRRLDLLVAALLLLRQDSGQVVDEAAGQIRAALSGSDATSPGGVWPALLSDARQHIADLHAQHANELENQRLSYEAKLEEMRREQERLTRWVDGLRSQIAEGREESRMDIRQDMLLVIAETLESLPGWADNPDALLSNVKARLALALGAGGAEEFGTIGETVPYDPRKHRAVDLIPAESPVRVCGPGTVVRGKLTGDRVLIKARVAQPSEVD